MAYAFNMMSQPKGNFIAMPPTTDLSVVFPYDKSNNRFDRTFYSPALTDGRMSSDQLNKFLSKVERIMKKKMKSISIVIGIYTFLALIGFAGLFCLICDSDSVDDDELDDLFCAMMWYFCSILFGGLFLKLCLRNRQRKVRKSIQNHINRNSPAFAAQGLRWNVPLHFPQWIELWKDYKYQPVYVQPHIQNYNSYMIPQQPQHVQNQPVFQSPQNNYPVSIPQSHKIVYPTFTQQNQQGPNNGYQPPQIPRGNYDN